MKTALLSSLSLGQPWCKRLPPTLPAAPPSERALELGSEGGGLSDGRGGGVGIQEMGAVPLGEHGIRVLEEKG